MLLDRRRQQRDAEKRREEAGDALRDKLALQEMLSAISMYYVDSISAQVTHDILQIPVVYIGDVISSHLNLRANEPKPCDRFAKVKAVGDARQRRLSNPHDRYPPASL